MNRWILSLTAASAIASLPLAGIGCGGKSSASGGGADGGAGGSDAGADVVHHDAAPSEGGGGNDGGGTLPEGGVGPNGTQLVVNQNVLINGVTSDGYAVYTDLSASTYSAVSLSGGTPIALGNSDGTAEFAVGPDAFSFTNIDMNTGGGTLSIWTSANGLKTISTTALGSNPGQGQLDVSTDGSHILYLDNVTDSTADVTVVDSDGTNKVVVVPGVDLTNQSCAPLVFFAGAYAAVQYCPTSGAADGGADAGADTATLQTFTGAAWATKATISTTTASGFGVDPTGANLIYLAPTGLEVAAVATGVSTLIDAQGTTGTFTNDGQHVLYVVGGAVNLASSGASAGAPTTVLAADGYTGIAAVSPDNNWLLAYKTQSQDSMGDTLSDLYLASATKMGSPTTLASTATAALFGDAFTADSSHAVFTASVTAGSGTLTAVATSGGSPATLGSNIWINNSLTAAKVVFNANYTSGGGGGGNGQADIMAVDTSTTTPATLLVTQADSIYFLDSAKDKVVYSWSYLTDGAAGIWVTPLP